MAANSRNQILFSRESKTDSLRFPWQLSLTRCKCKIDVRDCPPTQLCTLLQDVVHDERAFSFEGVQYRSG
jgi:hypothetical protein